MFSTAIYVGDHRILLDFLIIGIHNKINLFIILQTSFNNIYIIAHFIEYIIDYAIS